MAIFLQNSSHSSNKSCNLKMTQELTNNTDSEEGAEKHKMPLTYF